MSITSGSYSYGVSATIPVSVAAASGNLTVHQASAGSYTVGSSAGQAQYAYTGARTVASSASADVIDLNNLTDAVGSAISFNAVTDIHIKNTDTASSIVVGGGTDPVAFLPSAVTVAPGGTFVLNNPAGSVVTPSTAMNLKVAIVSAASSVGYSITMIGR